jgi:ubiquinone biosynthesis protein Coq4
LNGLSVLKHNLASLYGLFRLARDPDATRYVFMIGDAQDNLAEQERRCGAIRDPFRDQSLESLWQETYIPSPYRVERLLLLDPATLGGTYARHMKARDLRPDFYASESPRHKLHYLRLRIHQTHDIWHILTGFGTDPAGEVGLQGFCFAQFTNGQSAIIVAGAILRSILRRRYGDLERFVEVFCEGFHNGRRAKSWLGVKWELLWQESMEELRRRLDITPAR